MRKKNPKKHILITDVSLLSRERVPYIKYTKIVTHPDKSRTESTRTRKIDVFYRDVMRWAAIPSHIITSNHPFVTKLITNAKKIAQIQKTLEKELHDAYKDKDIYKFWVM